MPLREIDVPINSLLPIHEAGVSEAQLELIRSVGHAAKPVEVMPYGDGREDSESFLLLDGLHRTYINYLAGESRVRAKVIETDAQVRGSLTLWMNGLSTMEEVRARYRGVWLPLLESAGIEGVATVPIYRGTRT
jgi:hypothetical protein